MAGASTSKWQRFKFKYLKFLYKKCPEGNFHKKSDELCWCRIDEHCGYWHGGVLVFKTGEELIPYDSHYGNTIHKIWRLIKPFLRYTNKSINQYTSAEDLLNKFMNYVATNNMKLADVVVKSACESSEKEDVEIDRKEEMSGFQISEAQDYLRKHESKDGSESSIEVCIIRNLIKIIKNKGE